MEKFTEPVQAPEGHLQIKGTSNKKDQKGEPSDRPDTSPSRFREERVGPDTLPTASGEYFRYTWKAIDKNKEISVDDLHDLFLAIKNWDQHNSHRCLDDNQQKELHRLQTTVESSYRAHQKSPFTTEAIYRQAVLEYMQYHKENIPHFKVDLGDILNVGDKKPLGEISISPITENNENPATYIKDLKDRNIPVYIARNIHTEWHRTIFSCSEKTAEKVLQKYMAYLKAAKCPTDPDQFVRWLARNQIDPTENLEIYRAVAELYADYGNKAAFGEKSEKPGYNATTFENIYEEPDMYDFRVIPFSEIERHRSNVTEFIAELENNGFSTFVFKDYKPLEDHGEALDPVLFVYREKDVKEALEQSQSSFTDPTAYIRSEAQNW